MHKLVKQTTATKHLGTQTQICMSCEIIQGNYTGLKKRFIC